MELGPGDLAARGNLCTVDSENRIVDRRAGRIPTSESAPIVEMLNDIEISGVGVKVYPVQDYRFVLVLSGDGLDDKISETDPQMVGVVPLEARALDEGSEEAAAHVRAFVTAAGEVLREREYANMAMLRGFSLLPDLPDFGERYSLNPGAVAAYPMYRGLAKGCGNECHIPTGMTFDMMSWTRLKSTSTSTTSSSCTTNRRTRQGRTATLGLKVQCVGGVRRRSWQADGDGPGRTGGGRRSLYACHSGCAQLASRSAAGAVEVDGGGRHRRIQRAGVCDRVPEEPAGNRDYDAGDGARR